MVTNFGPRTARADGFFGQRLRVLPRPTVTRALQRLPTSQLLVTDSGYFPRAQSHGRTRAGGTDQTIVIICVGGGGWCHLNGTLWPVGPGQVLLIPARQAHSYGAQDSHPWTIWWLHVAGTDVPGLIAATGVPAAGGVRNVVDPHRLALLADSVVSGMERDETVSSLLAASGAAWHLLALIAADGPETEAGSPVQRTQRYLREHLSESITVAGLATAAGLSASHFATVFRKATGVPVLSYLTQLRMAQARELLDTTDLSVREIADQVGYRDAFYFSRHFRTVHHLAPTQYRAQHKG
jgi:AraC family transcriptional regulator of arabinose operon